LLKHQGKVYSSVVENTKMGTLMPIISSKIKPDSVVYMDSYSLNNALDISQFHHERVNHSIEFEEGENHINGIEKFLKSNKNSIKKI